MTKRGKAMRSLFARALASLLDDTSFFSRQEWARLLGVSTPAISQWVNDKTIPRADILGMMLDVISSKASVPQEPILEFNRIAARPSRDVSPLGDRMAPTIESYIKNATFAGLGRELRGLSLKQKVLALREGSWIQDEAAALVSAQDRRAPAEESHVSGRSDRSRRGLDVFVCPNLIKPGSEARSQDRLHWDSLLAAGATVVVGAPGCGKTAILTALQNRIEEEKTVTPLWLGADVWSDPLRSTSVTNDLGETCRRGNVHVLVDGFDECEPEFRIVLAKELLHVREDTSAKVTVASRAVSELSALQSFERYDVAPLTSLQAYDFFRNELRDTPTPARKSLATAEFHRFICHLFERRHTIEEIGSPLVLRSLWQVFIRKALTPFWETEGVGRAVRYILDEWDAEKNVFRNREEWASNQNILGALGALCFQLARERKSEFTKEQVETWLGDNIARVPLGRLTDVLERQGWVVRHDGRSRMAREYFRDYFAAHHIVESTERAALYVKDWNVRPQLRNVLRLACGLATDASGLIRMINEHGKVDEMERCHLLAEILAQPVLAESKVIKRSCSLVVAALDERLRHWRVESVTTKGGSSEVQWALSAHGTSKQTSDNLLLQSVAAIHQARSGAAGSVLEQHMKSASSPVLQEFAKAMQVEGHLQARFSPRDRGSMLSASIASPQIA